MLCKQFYCAWKYKYEMAVTMDFYKYMSDGMKENTPSYLNNWELDYHII